MLEKQDDLSTKQNIENALIALMRERAYSDISASALARRAGLSRQGFYLHFKGKDDVLLSYMLRLFSELMDSISKAGATTVDELVATYTAEVRRRKDTLRLLAINDLGVSLNYAFVRELNKRPPVLNCQREPKDENELRYINTFWVSAFIAVYTQWLADGMKMPDEELNTILTDIMKGDYFRT